MDGPLLETFTEDADLPRAFRRFAVNFPIGVSVSSDKPLARGIVPPARTAANMTNASMSGLCFSSMSDFAEGVLVQIEMDLGGQTHRVPAMIRRCQPFKRLGRTFYECGAQFIRSESTLRFLPLMAKHLLTRRVDRNASDPKN